MKWQAIARNDLRGAGHKRGVWGLFAGFLVGFGGLAVLLIQLGNPEFGEYLDLLRAGVELLVPLAGIVLGYEAVIGERESGRAVLSLSMPLSRADLIAGKLAGRTVLFAVVIAAASFITGVGIALTFPAFQVSRYIGFIIVSTAYGTVFLWLSAAFSMALSTSRRVIVVAFGAYIGLTLSWALLIDIVETILFRFQPTGSGDPETWATFATFVGPTTSFNYLLGEVLNIGTVPPVADTSSAEFITPTVAILAFVAWAVLPVITGYLSFRQSDL